MIRRTIVAAVALSVLLGVLATTTTTASAGSPAPTLLSAADAAVLPSAGCQRTPAAPGAQTLSVSSRSVTRTYTRHLPPGYGERALPLLIAFHGITEGPVVHATTTRYATLGATEGFVTVFPQGLGNPVQWDSSAGSNDVAFFGDLLDELEATVCIDTNRVYVSGYSMGAFLTSRLACQYADRIAAVAPIAGVRVPSDCAPARRVPMITMHGTEDPLVPWAPVAATVTTWATNNGCNPTPTETSAPGDEIVTSTLITFTCPDGSPVQYYRLQGAGHGWQGSEFSVSIASVIGYTTMALSTTNIVWDFFEHQALHRDIVSATARFDAATGNRIDQWAKGLGTTPEALVKGGAGGVLTLAGAGAATPLTAPAPSGRRWITVTWPASEKAAIDSGAAAWGLTPDQLATFGGHLVLFMLTGR